MPKKQLDFIVIGAAKSGTTTLHELLRFHEDIYIPDAKEVPFFSNNNVYQKGMEKYLQDYFAEADTRQVWGTITPQYMLGEGDTNPQIVAERMFQSLPNIKLIALLRDPTERAFSHYKMYVQRGHETREFEKIINKSLENPELNRQKTIPERDYIFGSEYGRILKYYYDLFPKENILVLTTDQLRRDPAMVVGRVCKFLNIGTNYRPLNTNKKYRQGGSRPKFRILTPGFLFKIPLVESAWKKLTPQPIRKRIEYTINLWNIKPDDHKLNSESAEYRKLQQFYAGDKKLLEDLTHIKATWT